MQLHNLIAINIKVNNFFISFTSCCPLCISATAVLIFHKKKATKSLTIHDFII